MLLEPDDDLPNMWQPDNPGNTPFQNQQTAYAIMLAITATQDGIWPKQKSHEEWMNKYGTWFSVWIAIRYTEITDSKKDYYNIIEHIVLWKLDNQERLSVEEWWHYRNNMTYLHDMKPDKYSLTPLIFKYE